MSAADHPSRSNDRTPSGLAALDQGAAELRDHLDALGVCAGDTDQLLAFAAGLLLATDTLVESGPAELLRVVDVARHLVLSQRSPGSR